MNERDILDSFCLFNSNRRKKRRDGHDESRIFFEAFRHPRLFYLYGDDIARRLYHALVNLSHGPRGHGDFIDHYHRGYIARYFRKIGRGHWPDIVLKTLEFLCEFFIEQIISVGYPLAHFLTENTEIFYFLANPDADIPRTLFSSHANAEFDPGLYDAKTFHTSKIILFTYMKNP
jgi:hypothetical protein